MVADTTAMNVAISGFAQVGDVQSIQLSGALTSVLNNIQLLRGNLTSHSNDNTSDLSALRNSITSINNSDCGTQGYGSTEWHGR